MKKQSKLEETEFKLEPLERIQAEIGLRAAEKPATVTKQNVRNVSTDESQVVSYRYPDKRKNNPHVGLVNETTDPGQPKTAWRYDPHSIRP